MLGRRFREVKSTGRKPWRVFGRGTSILRELDPKGRGDDRTCDPAPAILPVGARFVAEDAVEVSRPPRRRGVHGPRGLGGAAGQGGGPGEHDPGPQGGRLDRQDRGGSGERRVYEVV